MLPYKAVYLLLRDMAFRLKRYAAAAWICRNCCMATLSSKFTVAIMLVEV